MWADNETDQDLLGFSIHADLLRSIITNPDMLPVTVGLFGDWGGGKSSILKILQRNLAEETDFAVFPLPRKHCSQCPPQPSFPVSLLSSFFPFLPTLTLSQFGVSLTLARRAKGQRVVGETGFEPATSSSQS